MSNTPMFIGWKPIMLDFTRPADSQRLMMQMTAELAQRARAIKDQAMELKAPDMSGIHTDVTQNYDQYLEGHSMMVKAMNEVDNPFSAVSSDKFKKGQVLMMDAVSPGRKMLLKEQQSVAENYDKQIDENKGSAGMLFTDQNANTRPDPNDPSRPLTIANARWGRWNDPNQNVFSKSGPLDLKGAIIGTPLAFTERMAKEFTSSQVNEFEGIDRRNLGELEKVANAANSGAMDIPTAILLKQGHRSNEEQVMTAVNAKLGEIDPHMKASLLNLYQSSSNYRPDKFVGKDGVFDPVALSKAVFESRDYTHPLTGKNKITFAMKSTLDQGVRYLGQSNKVDAELLKGSGFGSNGAEEKKINQVAAMTTVGSIPTTAYIPVAVQRGADKRVVALKTDQAWNAPMTPRLHDVLNQQVKSASYFAGGEQGDGNPLSSDAIKKAASMKEMFTGYEARLPGGMPVDPSKLHGKIISVGSDMLLKPMFPVSVSQDKNEAWQHNIRYGSVNVADSVYEDPILPRVEAGGNTPMDKELKVTYQLTDEDMDNLKDYHSYQPAYGKKLVPGGMLATDSRNNHLPVASALGAMFGRAGDHVQGLQWATDTSRWNPQGEYMADELNKVGYSNEHSDEIDLTNKTITVYVRASEFMKTTQDEPFMVSAKALRADQEMRSSAPVQQQAGGGSDIYRYISINPSSPTPP